VSNEKINEKIMEVSRKVCGDMDAHLVESIVSLFHQGVLKHYVRSPRSSFNSENCKLTVEAANGVKFEGREKLIELQEKINKLEAQLLESNGLIKHIGDLFSVFTDDEDDEVGFMCKRYLDKYGVNDERG